MPADNTSTADTELIRLCGEVVAIQDKINALHKVRHTTEDEARTEPELSAFYAMQLDLIEAAAVPPATLGRKARLPAHTRISWGQLCAYITHRKNPPFSMT